MVVVRDDRRVGRECELEIIRALVDDVEVIYLEDADAARIDFGGMKQIGAIVAKVGRRATQRVGVFLRPVPRGS